MSIAQTQTAHPEPRARWAPVLRAHLGFIVAGLVLLAAFIALFVMVKGHRGPLPGDVGLALWWQHLVRPYHLLTTGINEFRAINFPIPATITMIVLIAVFALFRRWLDLAIAAVVVALADGGNWLVNLFVARPRPAGYGIVVDQHLTGYYSFPSGHVEHALAVLGIVVFLSFQLRRPAPWQASLLWVGRIALLALIVMQVPAAVLEGEHWPSDGLAALLWGGFWLLVGIVVYTWAAQRWTRLVPMNERKEALPRTT